MTNERLAGGGPRVAPRSTTWRRRIGRIRLKGRLRYLLEVVRCELQYLKRRAICLYDGHDWRLEAHCEGDHLRYVICAKCKHAITARTFAG